MGGRTLDVIVERTITDIVCMHSVKAGTVKFLYELDNDGRGGKSFGGMDRTASFVDPRFGTLQKTPGKNPLGRGGARSL